MFSNDTVAYKNPSSSALFLYILSSISELGTNVLLKNINIAVSAFKLTRFRITYKNWETNKSFGNVLIGLETDNHQLIEEKLSQNNFKFQKIKDTDLIYSYLI